MSEPAEAATTIEGRFAGRLGAFDLDATFSIPASGVTAISGPSGGGKTTLLRCIAGLTRVPGRLVVRGQVWQDAHRFLPAHRRAVGYVFQEPSLLEHLTVRANLLFGFTRNRGQAKVAFDDVIALLGVGPLLARSTTKLSGGERQRVAIGRALLSQPELLLMDEPLSSLDPESKAEILPYLDRLHQALSIPVIYVSHDPAEITRLADRVYEMRSGQIAARHDQSAVAPS
jgi:molybdate transport system ATP-binding protein